MGLPPLTQGHLRPKHYTGVEIVGLYWHLVDLISISCSPSSTSSTEAPRPGGTGVPPAYCTYYPVPAQVPIDLELSLRGF